jgi:hypothetical protein
MGFAVDIIPSAGSYMKTEELDKKLKYLCRKWHKNSKDYQLAMRQE